MDEQKSSWHYLLIWEFRVRPGCEQEFERVYGSHGDWAILFRRDAQYCGTELIRDAEAPGRYLTLDYWKSREAYDEFRRNHAEEYRRIDQGCEELTLSETCLGAFVSPSAG